MRSRLMTCLCGLMLLAACAHLSVVHLDKKQWIQGQAESLAMRYWIFDYDSRVENNRLVISGTARPVPGSIRRGARWLQEGRREALRDRG